jgi:hypothetical protein
MTLVWSALALAQVAFLPGYVVTRWLRLDDGFAKTWVSSFGISLVVNYHLTLLLTSAGLYGRPAVCAVIALEILALSRALRTRGARARSGAIDSPLTRFLCPEGDGAGGGVSIFRLSLFFVGIAPILYFATFLPGAFTTVFSGHDALVSWNRWAMDWMNGRFPTWTMHYPQLIPANWSMLYAIVGNELQFLPKGLSVLFPATTVLMLVDLGLRKSRAEFMLAAALTGVLMSESGGRFIASGYADLPIAFFGLAPIYLLSCARGEDDGSRVRAHVVAATICVVGCGLTKQAGAYLAAVFPLILFLFLRNRFRATAGMRILPTVAVVACVVLLFIVPWHVYKEIQVLQGFEVRENPTTFGVHRGRTLPERAIWAWAIWDSYLTTPLACFVALAVGLSLAVRRALPTTLLITIPFTAIWAFLFSYDRRNLALAYPFIGISAGMGAIAGWNWLRAFWKRRGMPRHVTTGLSVLALLTLATPWILREEILAAHDRELRKLGPAELNEVLYAFHEQHGFEGKILTNYRILAALPELREFYYFDREAKATEIWPFRDPDAFKSVLKTRRGEIRYIVVQKPADWRIMRFLKEAMDRHQLQVIYRTRKGLIVRLPDLP